MFNHTRAREVAREVAVEAGNLVVDILSSGSLVSQVKLSVGDLVTSADHASQAHIVKTIQRHYPHHNILGEEDCLVERDGIFAWVIDPVDGTLTMVQGMGYFGISIGLFEDGVPVVGVIYFPQLGILVEAEKNGGTWINGKRVDFRGKGFSPSLGDSVVAFDFSSRQSSRAEEARSFLEPLLPHVKDVWRFGCTTYATLLLLEGKIDAFVHAGAQVYDFAAAVIAVQEAGGDFIFPHDMDRRGVDIHKQFIPLVMSRSQNFSSQIGELLRGEIFVGVSS